MAAVLLTAGAAWGQAARVLNRGEYVDRLQAMWLGQCIANWTGLRTEGARSEPPLFTDKDWGTQPPGVSAPIVFVLHQDPWLADDDTDIEYVYLHLMAQAGRPLLTGVEIRDGWLAHMDPQYIWISNHRAWEVMHRGVTPAATSMSVPNWFWGHIDAQLTTEFFGALAPGMPVPALTLARLPIRTTASGYAEHAAQFYVLLYAMALEVDPAAPGHDRALQLVREARRWIPSSSKAAAAVDLVVADYLANPDVNDWERTRDLIYQHFQLNAQANGYIYRGWTESTVNFACGVMALLYGGCDYKRTVQIGTLSGWDSDNCTATLGGLLGLMLGMEQLRAQFPGQVFSDRFDIWRTRDNLPDYLPADPLAQDTLAMMSQRMLPLIDQVVVQAGGTVDAANNRWLLPPQDRRKPMQVSPAWLEESRSANRRARMQGRPVQALSSIAGAPPSPPWVHGIADAGYFANGYQHDFSGRDGIDWQGWFFTTQGGALAPNQPITLTVLYSEPTPIWSVRLIEGDHWPQAGGWFDSLTVQVLTPAGWITPAVVPSEALDPSRPFQIIDYRLSATMTGTGIRVVGLPGGPGRFITCAELDAIAPPGSGLMPLQAR
jgi:hypothetical protein